MCSSILTSIYIIGIFGAGLMTIVALFTPGWTTNSKYNNDWEGILWKCASNSKNCTIWTDLTDYQKAATGCMLVSAVVCAAGLVWGMIACFLCCCKSCLNYPLPIFPILALALNATAIIVYAVNTKGLNGDNIGYSMWIAIISCAVLAVDAVFGIFLCKCCNLCCI